MNEANPSGPHPRNLLKRRIARARLVLVWERLWRGLWPASGIAALVVAASFFDLWSSLPNILHGLLLMAALAVIGAALWRGFRGFRWPAREETLRRLEADSGFVHRPLAALDDRIAAGAGDPASESLWQAHRARLAAKLKDLRLVGPAPGLSRRDPFALRFLVLLILGTAAVVAGHDWEQRLGQALRFGFGQGGAGATIRLDAWVNPPAYTGAAPVFLLEGAEPSGSAAPSPVATPQGSTLVVRVYGVKRAPRLSFSVSGAGRATEQTLSAQQDGVFAIEQPLRQDGLLTLRRGARTLARFAVSLKADLPPKIALTEPVRATRQGALRLAYHVQDDFGVTAVELHIRKANALPRTTEILRMPLALPAQRTKEGKLHAYVDLTAHPWAGLPVTLELAAKDEAGQEGRSARVDLTLPERPFTDPLARALIEQRKHLARDPSSAHEVARFLEAATLAPEHFVANSALYLGLRAAYWRLTQRGDKQAIAQTGDLLWQIAVALEEGDRARAEDALAAARKELMDALARNAPEDEIEKLLGALKDALNRYLATIEEQAQRAAAEGRLSAPPANAQLISREDFDKLLDAIGDLSRTGARDAARQLLAGLDDILQNLSTNFPSAPAPGTPEAAANDALQALSELIGKERGLMDDTFRQSVAPDEAGKSATEQNRALSGRQDGLRRGLGGILQGLGAAGADIPQSFGRAERAMRDAHQALGQGQLSRALDSQKKAIEELRAGAQALAQSEFARSAGQGTAGGGARSTGMPSTDPFGRPNATTGSDFGGSVKVPEGMELRRAREILDEIERRASERDRPREELDYLDRLLKRF